MAKRENPYEAAFAAYLREWRIPYVAINEAHRALWGEGSIKNLDFLVSPPGAGCWLIDVKGRRFPAGTRQQYWKNWTTRDDLHGMASWEGLFGQGSGGLLVFAFLLTGELSPVPPEELYCHQRQWYAFLAMRWHTYASAARPISPRWGTVAMAARRFRELAVPARRFLQSAPEMLDSSESKSPC
jgi:hypothetical protein